MAVHTVTIDFWNTIVIAKSNGPERQAARIKAVQELGKKYNSRITGEQVQAARQYADNRFEQEWLGNQRTQPVTELISAMLEYLSIDASDAELQHLAGVFQESLYDGPPDLAPGVESALSNLSNQASLVIISDTMFSPGRVLRGYLKQKELYHYFRDFVFSDEVGVSKPHQRTFEKALAATGATPTEAVHIGDIHQTDIEGAQQIGMRSILYAGVSAADKDRTTADYICDSWDEVVDTIQKM